jgi:hypothetical protein
VTSTKNRARLVVAGAFAVAAVAAPFAVSVLSTSAGSEDLAAPACLAWFGNLEDGKCLSYSNGYPIVGGTPEFGIGSNDNGRRGPSFSTGPMLPGVIIDRPLA